MVKSIDSERVSHLIEPEEAKPDEKMMIITVSSNQGFSDSIDDDDCGQDCSHELNRGYSCNNRCDSGCF
ncbi:unnamed protein product [Arabidopsis halleri]